MTDETPDQKGTLRSRAWFARQDKMGFYYRSWLRNRGLPNDQFDGRPVIGICNTWSELTPCNGHFRTIAEHVRYGILEAGGYPLEFPVLSLGETQMRPSAMLYRNLASMDVEEALRANPLDGVVLLMGCDKTTPALLMGAASVDLPTIGVSGGPMLNGHYRGQKIGSGTNTISMSEQLRAGEISLRDFHEAEGAMSRSAGSCMTMGTASTMASVDLPTIGVSGGPMLNGHYRGQKIGSGTNTISMSEQLRAGEISLRDFHEAEGAMSRSAGSCMTMGTASTMASVVEAIGVGLPHNAAIPAVDARRNELARLAGRRIVEMVRQDQRLSSIMTREAFENAIRTLAAIGGSTNAVVHLLAIAGRLGVPLTLDDFDRLASEVNCLVNLKPSGEHLMEDFYYAGGLPVVLRELLERGLLHGDARTANGRTLAENVAEAECWNRDVIHTYDAPFKPQAGMAILRGNLCPDGAVIKPSAASPHLLRHTGRAVVFSSIEDLHARINDEALEIDATSIMVLQYCGPKGYPGMAEVGNMPLPPKLLREGVRDMIRISDARMSGTAYGTVVLHVAPEAMAGGNLALVRTGDTITLDVAARSLHLHVEDAELAARRAAWVKPPTPLAERGYTRMYVDHVLQADKGVDLDFLVGGSGAPVARDNH